MNEQYAVPPKNVANQMHRRDMDTAAARQPDVAVAMARLNNAVVHLHEALSHHEQRLAGAMHSPGPQSGEAPTKSPEVGECGISIEIHKLAVALEGAIARLSAFDSRLEI